MHLLKRLELNGFKSFAQKTTFDFSRGITAIVGPNGSGKTNIVDGIRWLLGERDAKNLRGGKGEDLIFAGTADRPRLGQAQASLYFDNGSKFFPLDFSEIAVSRRVNRDGTNHYFLNKAEVRLKDLVDFFAQARLGAKGFTVITQGRSDVFIQATPAERREMIEEVLGLKEYELKKREAERRLRTTETNLDKARALIEEILPHLRSLKRQTGRWERRDATSAELRMLEDAFFGKTWRELTRKREAVDQDIALHSGKRAGLEKEKRKAEQRLAEVEASGKKERKDLTDIKDRIQKLLERERRLQKDLGRLEAQIELAGQASRADPSLPSLNAVMELVKRIKERLTAIVPEDLESVEDTIREVVEEIDEILAPRAAAEVEAAPASLREQCERVISDIRGLDEELRALKTKEQSFEKDQDAFYAAFKAAHKAGEAAKEALERWEIERQQKQFEAERLALRREEWERQVSQAGRQPEEFADLKPTEDPFRGDSDGGAIERRMFRLRGELAAIGEVDEAVVREARETEERYAFLKREFEDLGKARNDLTRLIADLGEKIDTEFKRALHEINREFSKFFALMFDGGHARLKLAQSAKHKASSGESSGTEESGEPEEKATEEKKQDEEDEEPEQGIEIELKLPRKRATTLEMLSGGERSLVGIAALFALVSVSPPPFLVLDEVDAALDDRNARRFAEMLKEFSKTTQFVIVTHNRATMEAADALYGITMNDDATSKVVSLKLES